MSDSLKISLIVPTYNRTENTRAFIKAIIKGHQDELHEIIFTDDGSSEDQVEVLSDFKDELKIPCLFVSQEDRGFRLARCRNNGVNYMSGDYVCFLDQDIIPSPGYFHEIKKYARPDIFLISRTLYTTSEQKEKILAGMDNDYLMGIRNMDRGYLNRTVRKDFIYYLGKKLFIGDRRPKLKGMAFSLFKDKYELVNGFDESFIGWGLEDDDFGRRLYLARVIGRNISHKAWTYHLWHEPAPTKTDRPNRERYGSKVYNRNNIRPPQGLNQERGPEVKLIRIK